MPATEALTESISTIPVENQACMTYSFDSDFDEDAKKGTKKNHKPYVFESSSALDLTTALTDRLSHFRNKR